MIDKYKTPGFLEVLYELSRVQDNERVIILVACGYIEVMLSELLRKHGSPSSKENKYVPLKIKLKQLEQLNILELQHFDSLTAFSDLRNRAAHEVIFRLTENDLPPKPISLDGFATKSHLLTYVSTLVAQLRSLDLDLFDTAFPDSMKPLP